MQDNISKRKQLCTQSIISLKFMFDFKQSFRNLPDAYVSKS